MSTQKPQQQNRESKEERKARLAREHKIVGERIAAMMVSVNWSLADLCRHTGLDSGNLSKVVNGKKGISAYNLTVIEDAIKERQKIRRLRGDFRNEKSRSISNNYLEPACDEMIDDGVPPERVQYVQDSMIGIVNSAYVP